MQELIPPVSWPARPETLASRSNPGLIPEGLGQHLERDAPVELGISRLIDLAHPAFTDEGTDLVRSDLGAGTQCHTQL